MSVPYIKLFFKVLNFCILPKIELFAKNIFINDPCGHIERCGVATLLQNKKLVP